MKRIFDPSSPPAKRQRTCLATAYSISINHNGLMTVESEVHVGTTFTIYCRRRSIRKSGDAPQPSLRQCLEQVACLWSTTKTLFADLVEFTLTRLGYKVWQAGHLASKA